MGKASWSKVSPKQQRQDGMPSCEGRERLCGKSGQNSPRLCSTLTSQAPCPPFPRSPPQTSAASVPFFQAAKATYAPEAPTRGRACKEVTNSQIGSPHTARGQASAPSTRAPARMVLPGNKHVARVHNVYRFLSNKHCSHVNAAHSSKCAHLTV